MSSRQMQEKHLRWRREWGSGYAPDFKKNEVAPLLGRMDELGHLGSVVFDCGSGSMDSRKGAARGLLYPVSGRKVVRIDIGLPYLHSVRGNMLELRADIEDLSPSLPNLRRLSVMARHLGVDLRKEHPAADTLLLIDVLNYVDYRKTMAGLSAFLRPCGRIFISNIPGMGLPDAFSGLRPKNNNELVETALQLGFRIEHLSHPSWVPPWLSAGYVSPAPYPSIADEIHAKGSMLLVLGK